MGTWRLTLALPLIAVLALLTPAPAHAASTASFQSWPREIGWLDGGGALYGAKLAGTAIQVDPATTHHVSRGGQSFEFGAWQSGWRRTGFDIRAIVPSWEALTPGESFLKVHVRGRRGTSVGSWDTVATWAHTRREVRRTSHTGQTDDIARVAVDTVITNGDVRFTEYQVKVELYRPTGSTSAVELTSFGATTSTYLTRSAATSANTMERTTELAVPRYSQMTHVGEYPEFGGGGEAWCSPTSVSMVLRYFEAGPTDFSSIPYAHPWVDHAAIFSYDHGYDGTGNWSFSTAYAGVYATGFVTRLYDLRDAEQFIKAGIPLVASIRFDAGELTGSPLTSSEGHLLVITGFSEGGRVITNDPAATSSSTVRRVYSRAQFERAWLTGSGGIVYVIRPPSKPLPTNTARW